MKPQLVREGVPAKLKALGLNPSYEIVEDKPTKKVLVREKFSELAGELDVALKSTDTEAILQCLAKNSEILLLIGKEHGILPKQVREVREHRKKLLGKYSSFVVLREANTRNY